MEILICATTRMNLKDIMLSDMQASHKKMNVLWFYWHQVSWVVKLIETIK